MCAFSKTKTIRETDAVRDLCLQAHGLSRAPDRSERNVPDTGDALPDGGLEMSVSDATLQRRVRDAVRDWHSALPWYVQYVTPRASLASLVEGVVSAVRSHEHTA